MNVACLLGRLDFASTRSIYSELWNQLSETDPLGNTTFFLQKNKFNLLEEKDSKGNFVKFTYTLHQQVFGFFEILDYKASLCQCDQATRLALKYQISKPDRVEYTMIEALRAL